jgi:hypothetical protein
MVSTSVPSDAHDSQLNDAVVDQDDVVGFDDLGQPRKVNENTAAITCNFFQWSRANAIAAPQLDGLLGQLTRFGSSAPEGPP